MVVYWNKTWHSYLISASLTVPSGVTTRLGRSSELISWIRSSRSRMRVVLTWLRWLPISTSILGKGRAFKHDVSLGGGLILILILQTSGMGINCSARRHAMNRPLRSHDRMMSNSARMLCAAKSAFCPNSTFFSLRSSIFPLTYSTSLSYVNQDDVESFTRIVLLILNKRYSDKVLGRTSMLQ